METEKRESALLGMIILLCAIFAVMGVFLLVAEKEELEELSIKLPKIYAGYMDLAVKDSDTIAKCKSNYEKDMNDPRLRIDGKQQPYVIESIAICTRYEMAVANRKLKVDKFLQSDFNKKVESKIGVSWNEIREEREKLELINLEIFNIESNFRSEQSKYAAEKARSQLILLKDRLGYPSADLQIQTRFESADQAISAKDDDRFLGIYNELNSFASKNQTMPTEK